MHADAVSTVGTHDLISPHGRDSASKKKLWRAGVSASVYLFLSYLGVSLCYPVIQPLLLHRACHDRGLDKAMCKDKFDNDTKIPGYDDSQKEAANMGTKLGIASGLPQISVCLFFGVLGDSRGRRWALIPPTIVGAMGAMAWALLPASQEDSTLIIALIVLGFGGGSYVTNHAAMATLADCTQGASAEDRAAVFSLVEAANWCGILGGPPLGGALASHFGEQRTYYFIAGVACLNFLFATFIYEETLEPNRRKPFVWRQVNPFNAVSLFFETRLTSGLFCVLVGGMMIQTGNGAVSTLFLLKEVDGLSSFTLGLMQSTGVLAGCIGLTFALPLLKRCGMPLTGVLIMSMVNLILTYMFLLVASEKWYFWVVMGCNVMQAVFYPIIRAGLVNTFGGRRYGETLAAVGVMEQFTAMAAPAAFQQVYRATEDVTWGVQGLQVRCVTFFVGIAFALGGVAAAIYIHLYTDGIPNAMKDAPEPDDSDTDDGGSTGEVGCPPKRAERGSLIKTPSLA